MLKAIIPQSVRFQVQLTHHHSKRDVFGNIVSLEPILLVVYKRFFSLMWSDYMLGHWKWRIKSCDSQPKHPSFFTFFRLPPPKNINAEGVLPFWCCFKSWFSPSWSHHRVVSLFWLQLWVCHLFDHPDSFFISSKSYLKG